MNLTNDNLQTSTLYDGRSGLRAMLQVSCFPTSAEQHAVASPARTSQLSEGRAASPLAAAQGRGECPTSPVPSRAIGSPAADQPSERQSGSDLNSQPTIDFIASTAALDRYGEIIEPDGWRLDSYRKNPVFQNAHRYGDVLFTLGKAVSVEVREIHGCKALCLRVEFATEVNPIARVAYGLYKGGYLRAVSVGFIPIRWLDADGHEHCARNFSSLSSLNPSEGRAASPLAASTPPFDSQPSERQSGSDLNSQPSALSWRRRYIEQELLEVSAVAIPANPEALQLGLRSGAVKKADLAEALDILALAEPLLPIPAEQLDDSQLSTLNPQLLPQLSTLNCLPPPAEQLEVASPARTSQLSTLNPQLFLARELRRIMRA